MITTITGQLQTANAILGVNLDGIDHEMSLRQPKPAGNCLNWIVGHLITAYDNILPALGDEPVLSPEQKAIYGRGSAPLNEAGGAVHFEELRLALTTAHERVVEALGSLPEGRLAEPAPFSPGNNPNETLGSLLSLIAFHQAYHVGQTGLGRRLAGLGNAIR